MIQSFKNENMREADRLFFENQSLKRMGGQRNFSENYGEIFRNLLSEVFLMNCINNFYPPVLGVLAGMVEFG